MKSGRRYSLSNPMYGSWSVPSTLSSQAKSFGISVHIPEFLGDVDVPIVALSAGKSYSGNTSPSFGLAVAPINHVDPVNHRTGARLGNFKSVFNMHTSFDLFPQMGATTKVPRNPLPLNVFFFLKSRRFR